MEITDSDHHEIVRDGYEMSKAVEIGKHVWIGSKASILKGETIGDGAIGASGAIVTKDIPDHCLAAAEPAKLIKQNVEWK